MLESTSSVAIRAQMLIVSWETWRGEDENPHTGVLGQLTDTRQRPKSVGELRDLATHVQMYAERARALISTDGYADLDVKVQRDLVAIAEEMEAGLLELEDETHPDKKWAAMGPGEKNDATQLMRANDGNVAKFRARLRGDIRKQQPQVTPPGGQPPKGGK